VGTIQPPIQWIAEVKRLGLEADYTPASSVKVKNEWSCTSSPFKCLHDIDGDKFYL
jgi:hypothetical protein